MTTINRSNNVVELKNGTINNTVIVIEKTNKEGNNMMKEYETCGKAQYAFGKEFAGRYVIVKYGYETQKEFFGTGRQTQTYCHTGYSTDEEKARYIQYELFQVGKRGGFKRLHKVAKSIPEGIPFVWMKPDVAACCRKEGDGAVIIDGVLEALIESIPEADWHDGPGPVTDYH